MNTLCLGAIVKNESHIIKRMIDSCKDIIDYWVIIDTGSTDNTKEIIYKELSGIPGELIDAEWVNFSHNRNEVLSKCKNKSKYTLLMDADWELSISENFNKDSIIHDSYHLKFDGIVEYSKILLIKNELNFKYIGSTHEYIYCDDIKTQTVSTQLSINDHLDGGSKSDKVERDIRLLTIDVEKDPTDTRSHFYLAQSYMANEDYENAIKFYTKRVALKGWEEEVYAAKYQMGVCYQLTEEPDLAIAKFQDAYEYRPIRFDPLCNIGMLFRMQKKYQIALLYLEKAKSLPYPDDTLFINKYMHDFLIDYELSICYLHTRNFKKAIKYMLNLRKNSFLPKDLHAKNEQRIKHINDESIRIHNKKGEI